MQVHVFPVQQGNTQVPQAPAQQTRVKTATLASIRAVGGLRVEHAQLGNIQQQGQAAALVVQLELIPQLEVEAAAIVDRVRALLRLQAHVLHAMQAHMQPAGAQRVHAHHARLGASTLSQGRFPAPSVLLEKRQHHPHRAQTASQARTRQAQGRQHAQRAVQGL
jgi:hypothetical protein